MPDNATKREVRLYRAGKLDHGPNLGPSWINKCPRCHLYIKEEFLCCVECVRKGISFENATSEPYFNIVEKVK